MKKGVVFTIDAIVALGIFLSSLFLFSSFFVDTNFSGLAGSNIYAQSEKTLATLDREGSYFFEVYSNYENNLSNKDVMDEMASLSAYPVNLRFYVVANNTKKEIANLTDYSFDQKLVFRRFVIYHNSTEVEHLGNVTKMDIESGVPYSNISANLTVSNPSSDNWTNINLHSEVSGEDWSISGTSTALSLNAGESKSFNFTIEVPSNATAGNYLLVENLSYVANSTSHSEEYYKSFHVITYGMVEMEVGLE